MHRPILLPPHPSTRVPPGLTTPEVLVALVVLLVGLHGTLALQTITLRELHRALAVSRLASEETSLADSLTGQGCAPSSGTRSMNAGQITWRTTRSATALTVSLQVTPRDGTPWRSEAVIRC